MRYIHSMLLPDSMSEFLRLAEDRKLGDMTCYGSRYPFGLFPEMGLDEIEFAPITIFAGGNGSGKSTLLNVLAEKLHLRRNTPYNSTPYFEPYVELCRVSPEKPEGLGAGRMIPSDDVFQYIFQARRHNEKMDLHRESLLREYWQIRKQGEDEPFRLESLSQRDELKQYNDAMHRTPSRYVRDRLEPPTDAGSNGEYALRFFTEAIGENALYLLDEPENSLSPEYQEKLAAFLCDSVRFFGCQLVLATHSPILLAMPGARVYDLDARPACVRDWTELPNVNVFRRFFQEHAWEWEKSSDRNPAPKRQ